LRLKEGFSLSSLARVSGMALSSRDIHRLSKQGLIELLEDGRRLRASGQGRFILNEIVCQLSLGLAPVEECASVTPEF